MESRPEVDGAPRSVQVLGRTLCDLVSRKQLKPGIKIPLPLANAGLAREASLNMTRLTNKNSQFSMAHSFAHVACISLLEAAALCAIFAAELARVPSAAIFGQGTFATSDVGESEFLGGIRLMCVMQHNANHADTFRPNCISLPTSCYEDMFDVFRLPKSSVETSSAVGPVFWSSFDHDDDDPHLQIIHRKADVRKKGKTRGWEVLLSFSFKNNIVSGYIKGTPTSHVLGAVAQLKACITDVSHPMVLPLAFFSAEFSSESDKRQRDTRDWLRRLESTLAIGPQLEQVRDLDNTALDIDALSRDIVECHSTALWRPTHAYSEILEEFFSTMDSFWQKWITVDEETLTINAKAERKMIKLKSLRTYTETTLERLRVQRELLNTIMSQRDTRFNIEIAGEQRRIAYATKKDSLAMKTLALIGVIFLPGTFIATLFGMSFFRYESEAGPVSEKIWIYFATTVPTTLVFLSSWIWYEARQRREDVQVEESIEDLEKDIMATIRRRRAQQASLASPPVNTFQMS
ncbi:Mg2+ transporter protein, CorA-like/Zinc transport protein ZntB [Paramyrothecium foliicola]|nr:Mg2+ transporter protein, CorA-like/Zinc transport protein ZntB [Paramyrothecium foliicola]